MDISPTYRRLIFGLIVAVLVALGAYLLGPVAHGAGRSGTPREPAALAPTSAPVTRPTAAPPTGQPDIYQWLPFTPGGLAAAASVVIRFGNAYGSFTYTQDAAAYVAPLVPIASAQLVGQIEAAYASPGVAAARASGKQVAVGTATIGSIRAFGPSSLTFLVQVTQQLTETTGRSHNTSVYAVTVTGTGTTWQVTDVELASAGNT
jgi:hypothetical protein